jgi:hypothetical protein
MSEHQAEMILRWLEAIDERMTELEKELIEIKKQLKDEGEVSE